MGRDGDGEGWDGERVRFVGARSATRRSGARATWAPAASRRDRAAHRKPTPRPAAPEEMREHERRRRQADSEQRHDEAGSRQLYVAVAHRVRDVHGVERDVNAPNATVTAPAQVVNRRWVRSPTNPIASPAPNVRSPPIHAWCAAFPRLCAPLISAMKPGITNAVATPRQPARSRTYRAPRYSIPNSNGDESDLHRLVVGDL